MKMTKILALALALVMVVACFTACPPAEDEDKGMKVKIWVSEKEGVAELTQKQIEAFEKAYNVKIDAEISGVTEADAASKVLADVATAPDIYCFAQDQLARLVQAKALAAPSDTVAAILKEQNDANSVKAASVGGKLYAYPMTSDNGYYLYYDKSIVKDPTSLEAIIADIEAYNKDNGTTKWFRFALENGWYTASFFFATGCVNEWTTDESGAFTSVNDTFNSEAGIAAMKGMMKLAQSPCYNSDADQTPDTAAWVNGIWNANTAEELFGDNFGVCKLPKFTVDGTEYQLGSFSGNKLIGVKPQEDAERSATLALLAQYLSNEQCQLDRYDLLQWGPSNLNAQKVERVASNPSLMALADQNKYAVPQGNISGAWWDLAKVLGADAKTVASDDDIKTSLKNYEDGVKAVVNMTDEEKETWSVIGTPNGTSWNTDLKMTVVEEGVWESDYLTFADDTEFVLRRGGDWNFKIGAVDDECTALGAIRWNGGDDIAKNIKFSFFGLEAGSYKVRLVWDGNLETVPQITLVPQE